MFIPESTHASSRVGQSRGRQKVFFGTPTKSGSVLTAPARLGEPARCLNSLFQGG
jgi:hypothetical protein